MSERARRTSGRDRSLGEAFGSARPRPPAGPHRKANKAFTLIELLVVIAIISLLVSILLPSLRKAKVVAYRVVCLANQRHVMQAGQVYAGGNDGKFPKMVVYTWEYLWATRTDGSHDHLPAAEAFLKCLGEYSLMYCPARAEGGHFPGGTPESRWRQYSQTWTHITDYWMFFGFSIQNISGTNWPIGPDYGPGSDEYGPPGEVLILACNPEGEGVGPYGGQVFPGNHGPDGCVSGLLDGHAEFVPKSELRRRPITLIHRWIRYPYMGHPYAP